MPKPIWRHVHEKAAKFKNRDSEYFLSAGLDYKGQAQTGYTMNGGGLSTSVSIDPGKIIGLAAEVGVSGSLSRAAETLLVVHRGPDSFGGFDVYSPIVLNCLAGVQWEGSVGASLDVGVKFEASAGVTTRGEATKVESSLHEESEPEPEDPAERAKEKAKAWKKKHPTQLEVVGVKAEFKAGLEVSASYKYTHLYAEDPAPMYFQDPRFGSTGELAELKNTLDAILETGTTKAKLKKDVCQLINGFDNYFGGTISLTSWTGGHTASQVFIDRLSAGIARMKTRQLTAREKALMLRAKNYLKALKVYTGEAPARGNCYLRLSCHNPKAAAALVAKAEASVNVLGLVSGSAEVAVTAAGVEASAKRAYLRYQTCIDEQLGVLCSQDTRITYAQIKPKLLNVRAEASGQAFGRRVASTQASEAMAQLGEEGYGLESAFEWGVNRMSYESAVAYWQRPASREGNGPLTVTSVIGTGVAFGTSVTIKSLHDLVMQYDPLGGATDDEGTFASREVGELAEAIAERLQVPFKSFLRFLSDVDLQQLTKDLFNQGRIEIEFVPPARPATMGNDAWARLLKAKKKEFEEQLEASFGIGKEFGKRWEDKAVLIEATFAVPHETPLTVEHKWQSRSTGMFSSVNEEYFILSPDTRATLMALDAFKTADKREAQLQSIRLRYRIQDLHNDDKTRFTLGFKVLGTGAKISLQTIDRAGSEGIVDLCTVWLDRGLAASASGDPKAAYETAVPPVTLFCQ